MKASRPTAHRIPKAHAPISSQVQHQGKQRVLRQGLPSVTPSIANAVVIKNENVFFLTDPNGNVPLGGAHGLGLYYHDCRFLNGYELRLAEKLPDVLVANATPGFEAVWELSNPEIMLNDEERVPKDSIAVKLERLVDGSRLALYDVLTFHNYGRREIELPITLTFESDFEDIFDIRGLVHERDGKKHAPVWRKNALFFDYLGRDQLHRSLSVYFSPSPQQTHRTTARFWLRLEPKKDHPLLVSLHIAESSDEKGVRPQAHYKPKLNLIRQTIQQTSNQWMMAQTQVGSDSLELNRVLERSLRDLRVLHMQMGKQAFIGAGVPWFATLFGRYSLITELQTLAFFPDTAAQTLRILARYQGRKIDEWRDEQPGKILHEIRFGELARTNEIPHTPYYGTVDATPLFLILLSRHAAWTGDLQLFDELRDNVERALNWIDKYGDSDADGYIDYQSASRKGLVNQGWKDSGDSIVNVDGSLAVAPIALVEVQSYVYFAKLGIADLYERVGESTRATQLRQEANQLRERFNRDFWMSDRGTYALALQAGGKPAAVIASNAGHALWSGIADADKAPKIVEGLMANHMFNGWGIRTLSENEDRYNPLGYHLGTVWPHDNSLIAAGFRRYGFIDAARQIANALLEAALYFEHYRLPELFAGFARTTYDAPVRYPVACHPQAWAAGAVPSLIETLLGLAPEAFDHRLRIVQPILPDMVHHMQLHGLRVGQAMVDLAFDRMSNGGVDVQVLQVQGHLEVVT